MTYFPISHVCCGTFFLAVCTTSPVAAQQQDATSNNAATYDISEFEKFTPRTALDIAQQVPGFTIDVGEKRRGLGEGGANVLIDSKRVTGKTEDVLNALSRISAGNVVRVEVLDGTTLGIPGLSGPVLNIVRKAGGIQGSFAYVASVRTDRVPLQFGKINFSLSGGDDSLGWSLAFDHDQRRIALSGPEYVRDGDGTLTDVRNDLQRHIGDQPTFSAALRRSGPGGDILNLNAELRFLWFKLTEQSLRFGSDIGQTEPERIRELVSKLGRTRYKLGGDYETGLGKGQLKLIGLHSMDATSLEPEVTTFFSDGSVPTGTLFRRDAVASETIARVEYGWSTDSSSWQFALEGALNSLDVNNTLALRDASGVLQPADFPDSKVSEQRTEGVLNYARTFSPELSIQASVGMEYSRIRQSGTQGLVRSFMRPKGSLDLTWNTTPDFNLSAGVAREVGQLDFFDFIASVDPNNGNDNSSNPELVPPQSWIFDMEGTLALGNWGNISSRAYLQWITDIVDQVPIGATGQAPGNLESGRRIGVEWTSTLLGERAGLPGAKLDTSLVLESSRLVDPLTGQRREITGNRQRRLKLVFRHDIPGSDIAWGGSWQSDRDAAMVRLDSTFCETRDPGQAELFLEHKSIFGLTLRGSVLNILDDKRNSGRLVFDGRRTGSLLFSEQRKLDEGLKFQVELKGSL